MKTELLEGLPEVIAWVTWQDLADVIAQQHAAFRSLDPSVNACVARLVQSLLTAVARHS